MARQKRYYACSRLNVKLMGVSHPSFPFKETYLTQIFQITIETNKAVVNLLDLFSELNCEAEGGQSSCIAFKSLSSEVVTVLAAKNSRK